MTVDLALNPLSATDLLASFGTVDNLVVLFAETGLLVGSSCPATPFCSPRVCCARRERAGCG